MATESIKERTATPANLPKIKWDDSNMKSSYANVCNVSTTREEVILLFGMNQAWQNGQKEVAVQLTERIIVSPFAAKRLLTLLSNVVNEYETRFGALPSPTAATRSAATESSAI